MVWQQTKIDLILNESSIKSIRIHWFWFVYFVEKNCMVKKA